MDDDDETIFIDIQVSGYQINSEKLQQLARKCLSLLGLGDFNLSLLFTDSENIRLLNKQYRNLDKSTDVLSFPQQQWQYPLNLESQEKNQASVASILEHQRSLGDIIISLPNAVSNATEIGQSLDRECCFLLVHGILHLCGHDHIQTDDEALMLRNQYSLMEKLQPPQEPNWAACVVVGITA